MRGSIQIPESDVEAFARMARCSPFWTGLCLAKEAVKFDSPELLHAGPPLTGAIPAPLRNSAAAAVVFEGWARDEKDASQLLERRLIRLTPAQDRNCVVPLAAVLSPSMVVHRVRDRSGIGADTFSPLNGGNGPSMHLGFGTPDVVTHLRWLNGEFAARLAGATVEAIDLLDSADMSLTEGDDCHGRTAAATAALARVLGHNGLSGSPKAMKFLQESPGFFLNLWMAASKSILSAAIGIRGSSCIIAAGGNGVDFGIRIAGDDGGWITRQAIPPTGKLAAEAAWSVGLPAIGDSAVVDALGLGAMAMAFAPVQKEVLGNFMPAPSDVLANELLYGVHPRMKRSGARFGLCAAHLADRRQTFPISLGILDRDGLRGRIGGGIYCPPVALFEQACEGLTN